MPSVSELASRYDQLRAETGGRAVRRVAGSSRAHASNWADMAPDIMRLVVDLLPLHDVQSTMLVCREWQNGFANGLLELKPRRLRVSLLAARYAASPDTPLLRLSHLFLPRTAHEASMASRRCACTCMPMFRAVRGCRVSALPFLAALPLSLRAGGGPAT